MTPIDIALIREGFARIAPAAEATGLAFYERLFTLDPSTRRLFHGDLRTQANHLMTTLALVVNALDDLTPVLDAVRALGRRHAGYGVEPRHFDVVGAALLDTLAGGLGEAFTPQARTAWTGAYRTLAATMLAAMAEAGDRAA